MSMSTGDVRRPSNPKQAKAAASDKPEAEVVDGPKGGVLPVKKASRPGSAKTSATTETADVDEIEDDLDGDETETPAAAKATGSRAASARTGAQSTGSQSTGSKSNGTRAAGSKTPAARSATGATKTATPTKDAGAKTPVKSTGSLRTTPAKGAGARPGGKPGGRPAGGGKGRKPLTPVRVSQGRNWGPIAMFGGAALVAILIVGFGAWKVIERDHQGTWQERANKIDGIHNYLVSNPEWFAVPDPNVGNHKNGVLEYPTSPPVGGVHNPRWQSCLGDVFPQQVPKEQATHSMEHGAVWITYSPDLPKDQVDKLASKVSNVEFMLMSPYPGLDSPISLQAWGYQLKVSNANDGRIDDFINALRKNATQEPEAGCQQGITDMGATPLDLDQTGG